MKFIDDPKFEEVSPKQAGDMVKGLTRHTFLFLVDRRALEDTEHAIQVIDLADDFKTFRVIPSEIWGIENNLSIANMNFEEFADAVQPDGVFRGFPGA